MFRPVLEAAQLQRAQNQVRMNDIIFHQENIRRLLAWKRSFVRVVLFHVSKII